MGLEWSDEEGFVCSRIGSYFIYSRLIESSLGSVATKFNFFIHNLAQLRFSGLPSNDEPILSFSAKTYSLKQDGRIKQVSVFTYQKRYNPDKHYVSMWNLFALYATIFFPIFFFCCCLFSWIGQLQAQFSSSCFKKWANVYLFPSCFCCKWPNLADTD